jgi:tRNA pseudouridine55 synthase
VFWLHWKRRFLVNFEAIDSNASDLGDSILAAQRAFPNISEGLLLIDKVPAMTSFGVVARIRKQTGVARVGHAGTLDPFATGILVVGVGKTYTRQLERIQKLPKTYVVRMVLGIETDTLDRDGKVLRQDSAMVGRAITASQVAAVLPQFVGELAQIPPIFSAKKVDGKKNYERARAGEVVVPKASQVHVYRMDMHDFVAGDYPLVTLEIACGKGTYIRSIVRDVAAALGTVGYAKDLIRTVVGDWQLSDCLAGDKWVG